MFSWIKQFYFPVFSVLAAIVYALKRWGGNDILPSWAAHYMNDFFCMPIVLYVCRYVVRLLRSDSHLELDIGPILSLTLFYSLYFEGYLPLVNARYTADPKDVLLYFLGAAFFYLIENRWHHKNVDRV